MCDAYSTVVRSVNMETEYTKPQLKIRQTYGPFTRNYDRPEYAKLSAEERAKIIARQGHSFAQADEVRVVRLDEHRQRKPELVDTADMEPGEVITRGNIVMKEVRSFLNASYAYSHPSILRCANPHLIGN
jgi:hypothetical protein